MLNIPLSADAEAKLRDRAQASGISPELFAARIVEEAVGAESAVRNGSHANNGNGNAVGVSEIERRLEALRALAGSVRSPGPMDDSRESIYAHEDDVLGGKSGGMEGDDRAERAE